MKTLFYVLISGVITWSCPLAQAQSTSLTINVPECRMFTQKLLPEKYQRLAKARTGMSWLSEATPDDHRVNGNGSERTDGSSMYDWLDFFRLDIDNDGYCDWYINDSAPISTGGDRDSINTLYIGRKDHWMRVGAAVPEDKPDELGFGKTTSEQQRYLFGEQIAVIHDSLNKVNYLVTSFDNRNAEHDSKPGYRILTWDHDKNTLRLLDKWQLGSKAAEVYAFFKAHGAWLPSERAAAPEDKIQRFDPETENFELEQACNPKSPQRAYSEIYGAISPYLLSRCKH